MSSPSVEVVIPHTAGAVRLEAVLGDLRGQDFDHAVCVADNAAPPESVALARDAGARVVAMGENAGFARAVNAALRSSEATLVVLLNDDCRPERHFIEEIVMAQRETGAAMVAGVLLAEAGTIDSAGVEAHRSLLAYDFMQGEPYRADSPPARAPLGPTGGAAAFLRAELIAAGGFDERFFAYLEDVDLALRMRALGHRCALAWKAVAVHHHSATLGTGSAAKNRLMGESRGRLVAKWRPALGARDRLRGALLDAVTYGGKALIDRNLAAIRGRLSARREGLPTVDENALAGVPLAQVPVSEVLRRRLARRTQIPPT